MKLIKYIALSLSAMMSLTACNETDIDLFDSPASEEGQGTLASSGATVSKLDFSWQHIDGVDQYGYRLTDPDDRAVRQGITRDNSLHFDNLEADTRYTLHIEAYGHNGVATRVFSLSASTDPIVTLAAPQLSTFTFGTDEGRYVITWAPVANAEYYDYELLNSLGDELLADRITEPVVTFKTLPIGNYTLRVTAGSDTEGFLPSPVAEYTFSRDRQVTAQYTGTYTSAVKGSWTCTMKQYDDGAYVIENFYGIDGYNLEVSISSSKVVTILNYYYEEGAYRYVETGLADAPTLIIYENPSYCTYSVLPTGKRLKIYCYLGDSATGDYDTFTWK